MYLFAPDTRSIFYAGFNSEFSFSYVGSLIKAKEPILPKYLAIAGWENR